MFKAFLRDLDYIFTPSIVVSTPDHCDDAKNLAEDDGHDNRPAHAHVEWFVLIKQIPMPVTEGPKDRSGVGPTDSFKSS